MYVNKNTILTPTSFYKPEKPQNKKKLTKMDMLLVTLTKVRKYSSQPIFTKT